MVTIDLYSIDIDTQSSRVCWCHLKKFKLVLNFILLCLLLLFCLQSTVTFALKPFVQITFVQNISLNSKITAQIKMFKKIGIDISANKSICSYNIFSANIFSNNICSNNISSSINYSDNFSYNNISSINITSPVSFSNNRTIV